MFSHQPFNFHSLDQLRNKIAEMQLDLDISDDPSILLQPAQVGKFALPNRLVIHPMEGCDSKPDGSPDELTFRRYQRFAAGGAGLLWIEATAVVEEGRANPRQLWIRRQTVPSFAALVDSTLEAAHKSLGSHHRPLLVLQLTHSGRYSRPGKVPIPIIAHRSRYLDPLQKLPPDYPLISDDELERLEDMYVEAARCAQEAGFDAVDIKACHRYLVSELHASHTREDRYGGSFENRTRFFRNVVGKIGAAVPGLTVTARMNAYDAMPHPYGFGMAADETNKADLSEPIRLVEFLRDSGTPLVNITIGNPYYNPYVNRPFDLPTAGGQVPPESPLEGVSRFVHIVRQIQSAVPEIAVIGGGYSWLRQFFPYLAATNVQKGWVSLVGVGRMAFAYPDFARDLAEKGALNPDLVCVACSACTQIMRDGGRSGCVPRDAAIYEPIYKSGRAEALDTILEMAKTCRTCNDPTCVSRCPASVNIPEFVGHIAAGRFQAAYETLRAANVLAAVCGYVCPSETLCESACINQHYSESVPIRHLQRWISRKAVEEGWVLESRRVRKPSQKRVAVLGAGPAGVSAAVTLASLGHSVTLFDRGEKPGGTAAATIPEERLPGPLLRAEIQGVLQGSGVTTQRFRAPLDASYTLDDVLSEGFDAALIALGLSQSAPLSAANSPRSGRVGALEFLSKIKGGESVTGTVLVIGGGNTAIDAAVSAKKAGASDVSIVYRRSFLEMPAWPAERDAAMRSGINFLFLTAPVDYQVDGNGALTGLRVIRTRMSGPGPDGRRMPIPIEGTQHAVPAEMVIEALGQQIGKELRIALSGVRLTDRGLVWVQPGGCQTTKTGVFAAGDIINGGATVVQAVAEGTRAAREIDTYLRGIKAV
jgi:2,4-dienoyl-CoA reductase (NADPH2)